MLMPELGVVPSYQTSTCLSRRLVARPTARRDAPWSGGFGCRQGALLLLSLSAPGWIVQRGESEAAFPHHPRALLGLDGAGGGDGWEEPGLH